MFGTVTDPDTTTPGVSTSLQHMECQLPARSLRWRQLYDDDGGGESWALEVRDTSFTASTSEQCKGWRPVATMWKYDEDAERPYRVHYEDTGTTRDYKRPSRAFENAARHVVLHLPVSLTVIGRVQRYPLDRVAA
jgi:hypothetical protein